MRFPFHLGECQKHCKRQAMDKVFRVTLQYCLCCRHRCPNGSKNGVIDAHLSLVLLLLDGNQQIFLAWSHPLNGGQTEQEVAVITHTHTRKLHKPQSISGRRKKNPNHGEKHLEIYKRAEEQKSDSETNSHTRLWLLSTGNEGNVSLNTTHGSTHGSLDLGWETLLNRASPAHPVPRRESNRKRAAIAAVAKKTIKKSWNLTMTK